MVTRPVQAPAFSCPGTREEFDRLKERTREAVLDLLGRPPFDTPPPLNPQVVSETDLGSCVRKKVRYGNETDDVVWAWLHVPKGVTKPTPAIICLPGSFMTPNWGKDGPAGLVAPENPGDPEAYGLDLAERGYLTLSPDYACAGERTTPGLKGYDTTEFDKRFPLWSRVGMCVWDVSRAVDFLLTLSEVDPTRIGCTGWSQGGGTTLFGAAMDSRIAAAVSVCGWGMFRGSVPTPNEMASYNYPRLRPYAEEDRPLAFDMDHVAAMIAPRPLLILNGKDDHYLTNKADDVVARVRGEMAAAEAELARLYEWLGAGERFRVTYVEGDHAYGFAAAQASQAWFDRWLRRGA